MSKKRVSGAEETTAEPTGALPPLHPNEIVRKSQGPRYFGLKKSQLKEAIQKGLIEPPFPLVEGGRATGWTGQTIIDHQQRRKDAAARR
jgi:predicted DNA-binding transcriptional regulator AlpA